MDPTTDSIMAATEELRRLVLRLENVTNRFEGLDLGCLKAENFSTTSSAPPPAPEPLVNGAPSCDFLDVFDEIVEGPLAEFVMYARRIESGVLTEQCDAVAAAFSRQREFLALASRCRKPATSTDLATLLKPTSDALAAAVDVRDKNRHQKEVINHLQAIGESIGALGWVAVDQDVVAKETREQTKERKQPPRKGDGHIPGSGEWKPGPASLVREMSNASQFYSNRVVREYKEQDPRHEAWCKAWARTLDELEAYVMRFHSMGVNWKKMGEDPMKFDAGKARRAAAPPPAGVPPPPPPPPPADLLKNLDLDGAPSPTAPKTPSGDRGALFASINRGEGITSGLKKVDAKQMTHKNPELRLTSVVHEDDVKKSNVAGVAGVKKSAVGGAVKKAPVLVCEAGKKWVVENYRHAHNVVLDEVTMKQTVYIYDCSDSMITVEGKCNSITLDKCKKVALVFSDIVCSVDVVNCQSVQLQSLGTCPTVGISNTDGCQVLLCEKSLGAEILTSKSSEMNVGVPDEVNGSVDHPVPEQFKTVWDGQALRTEVVDIN